MNKLLAYISVMKDKVDKTECKELVYQIRCTNFKKIVFGTNLSKRIYHHRNNL